MKVVILAAEREKVLTRLCGIPLARRLLYTLRAAGLRDVIIVTGPDGHAVKEAVGDGKDLGVCVAYVESEGAFPVQPLKAMLDGPFLLIEGNCVLDERIVRELAKRDGLVIAYDSAPGPGGARAIQVLVEGTRLKRIDRDLEESNGTYVGAALCDAEMLPSLREHNWPECLSQMAQEWHIAALDVESIEPYVAGMRRSVKPFWFRVDTEEDARLCKEMLVEGAQKRTLDLLAWNFNRPIENWIIRRIADFSITPNQMSVLTYIVAGAVTFLLLSGRLLPGALLSFAVNVMDGLDGKLARVKGMATKLGHLEHSFDLLYEQSWYVALSWAVFNLRGDLLPLAIGFVALLFDSFARHCSMQFKEVMGVSLADYAPFDRLFRRFDGRRNIYTIYILLGALFGVPFYALLAIAGHAILTSVVYACRAAKHLRDADLGITAYEREMQGATSD